MRLENIVIDAADPVRLGDFWARALGATVSTHESDLVEARLQIEAGPWFDLCFPRVEAPADGALRLHLDLAGGDDPGRVVERLIELGAEPLDIGQGDVPWVVLADPEGNPFCVLEQRPEHAGSGPIAALPIDSPEPARDAEFWALLTGWRPVTEARTPSLRHPCGRGPLLEFYPEPAPKTAKNRIHLDVRPDGPQPAGAALAATLDLGASRVQHSWGDLPWTVLTDPGGNEFCLLGS